MASFRGGSRDDAVAAEARARVSGALRALDAFSFWMVPTQSPPDATVVAGTTGVFLVMPCGGAGAFTVGPGGARLGGLPVPGVRALRKGARALNRQLVAASVFATTEPVVCLTHGLAGSPRTARGVRYVHARDLVKDLAGRPACLNRNRAQRAARTFGMRIAGDDARHFSPK